MSLVATFFYIAPLFSGVHLSTFFLITFKKKFIALYMFSSLISSVLPDLMINSVLPKVANSFASKNTASPSSSAATSASNTTKASNTLDDHRDHDDDDDARVQQAQQTQNTKKKTFFYKQDVQDFVKWGSIGFLGLGIYTIGMKVAKRNINSAIDLKDQTESVHLDQTVLEAFLNLQSYRDLNPWLFRTALHNIDHLLFLEDVLLRKVTLPTHNDKIISFSYFRIAVSRMNAFQLLVKERLGNDHGLVVNILIKNVYTQLQKHLLNILHMCSEFKPENLIARAQQEVDKALEEYR